MAEQKVRKEREELFLYGHANGVRVINGNVEAALRKWKRMMKDSGIIDYVKHNREYTKPTTVRRKKRNDAIRAEWVRRRREDY